MLQETHFPNQYSPSFIHQKYPQFFLANPEDKTRGVAIIFSKCLNFPLIRVVRDPNGRYLAVNGTIDGEVTPFSPITAPIGDKLLFFEALALIILTNAEGVLV